MSAPGDLSARPGWLSRHKGLVAVLMVVCVLVAGCGGWAVYLNSRIADVPRVALDIADKERPQKIGGAAEGAVNILLAGADAGGGPSIADAVADQEWPAYSHRSDTIMVLHVTADHDAAYLVSIPRDSWVSVDGVGPSKINAAFAAGGPSLYVKTVEEFTGLRMDHLVIIDWNGFRDLTKALGGVEVYIPDDIYDPKQQVQWHKGYQDLEGARALQYVRMRYGLENGDFDRIRRQQNFLRATMRKVLSGGTTNNPLRLTRAVEAITSHLVVDDGFSNGEMRGLALSMRGMDAADVTFLTTPKAGYDTIDGQSVILVDEQRTKALFRAVAHDDIDGYLEKYGRDGVLGRQGTVS